MTKKCTFCNNSLLQKEESNLKLYGKHVCNAKDCLDKANAEALDASSQSVPDYIPLDMIQLMQDTGWAVRGWSACKGIGVDGVTVRIDFKTLPLEVYTRVGKMPWTGLAENSKFRHPEVQAELLKVQELVRQCSKAGAKHEEKHTKTEAGKVAPAGELEARGEVKKMGPNKELISYPEQTPVVRPLTQNQIIAAASSTSKLLVDVIEKAKLFSMISGKKYVRVEGWETLGALLLCSSEIMKSEEYKNGYKAEAIIRNQDGKVISTGIGICLRTEKNWATRDDFAICSMAQTRAIGKAYRLGFAWIMSLAGYEVCPVEEME